MKTPVSNQAVWEIGGLIFDESRADVDLDALNQVVHELSDYGANLTYSAQDLIKYLVYLTLINELGRIRPYTSNLETEDNTQQINIAREIAELKITVGRLSEKIDELTGVIKDLPGTLSATVIEAQARRPPSVGGATPQAVAENNPQSTNSPLLNTTQAAELLGKSRQAVTQHIWSGRLPAQRLGREYQIRREDVERLRRESSRRTAPAEPERQNP